MNDMVTVITVVYNGVEVIEETILSVLNQTYSNVEYIVIDGGSTDGTIDIIKKHEDRISYWKSEPDKGIYDAMNKGINRSSGKWINFMNAGDTFYDNRVLKQIFDKNGYDIENADVLYGDTIENFSFANFRTSPRPLYLLEYHMCFCHQSSFVRADLLRKNTFNDNYKICADYNLFYNLYKVNKSFKYIPEIIAIYDAEEGLSSINGFEVIKEVKSVNNRKRHYFISFLHLIKENILKMLIPQKVYKKMTIKKLKKRHLKTY